MSEYSSCVAVQGVDGVAGEPGTPGGQVDIINYIYIYLMSVNP